MMSLPRSPEPLAATLLCLCALAGCSDEGGGALEPSRTVAVRFAAQVHGAPFACGQRYEGVGTPATPVTPKDLRFYVHAVRLVDTAGEEVPLQLETSAFQHGGVALLDFEDGTGACTEGDAVVNHEVRGQVPDRRYHGVRFTLGVPQELNHQSLTDLPSPLDKSSLYWSWRLGRVFLAATTRSQPDTGVGVDHFTHVGATDCEGDPEAGIPVTRCAKPNRPELAFDGFDPDLQAVAADLGALKQGSDVSQAGGCHSFTPPCQPAFANLGLDWQTGAPTPDSQTFFSVR